MQRAEQYVTIWLHKYQERTMRVLAFLATLFSIAQASALDEMVEEPGVYAPMAPFENCMEITVASSELTFKLDSFSHDVLYSMSFSTFR